MRPAVKEFIIYASIGVALIFLVASCMTEKKRLKICQTCTLESKKTDSTLVTVRERTVAVPVPGPTLYVATPNPCAELCDSSGRLRDGVRINVPGTSPGTRGGTIFTRGDSLHVRTEADSLRVLLAARDSTIKRLVIIENTAPARCELDHVTDLDAFFMVSGKAGWIILGLVALGWYLQRLRRQSVV